MTTNTNPERYQAHFEALTAQLGPRATPAALMLARRAAGLAVVCEVNEAELSRTGKLKGVRDHMNAIKLLQNLCIAIGVALNPRTATTGQRAATANDDHAAAMLED